MATIPAIAQTPVTWATTVLRRIRTALAVSLSRREATTAGQPAGPVAHEVPEDPFGGLVDWKVGWSVPGNIS